MDTQTQAHTQTRMHTDVHTGSILRNQACTGLWPECTEWNRDQKSKKYANKLEIKEMVPKPKMKTNPKAFPIPILTVAVWLV